VVCIPNKTHFPFAVVTANLHFRRFLRLYFPSPELDPRSGNGYFSGAGALYFRTVMIGLVPAFKDPLSLLVGVMKLLFHAAAEGLHFLGIGFIGKIEWLDKVNHLSTEG